MFKRKKIGNPSHSKQGKFASSDYKITLRRQKLTKIIVVETALLITLTIILADLTAQMVAEAIYPIPEALKRNIEPQKTTQELIIDEITAQAQLFGVDVDKALALAKCESGLNPVAKNPSSTARGVYQYLIGTWEETESAKNGLERNDYKANIHEAMLDLANGEAWRWPACRLVAGL